VTDWVIAGAGGFLGRYLVRAFRRKGDGVRTIGRSAAADAGWDDPIALARVLDGADVLLNLAGRSVNCRYTEANRREILESRVRTTRLLAQAVRSASRPPRLWLNASTATIYRHADDRPMTESGGELGAGFSVEVAKAWEHEFFAPALPRTRRVSLRLAIVLGRGSVLPPLVRLVRFGLGGPQLDGRWFATRSRRAAGVQHENRHTAGRQRFSWVHIEDVRRAIEFLVGREDLTGAVNVASPNPSDSRSLMRTLRRVLRVPVGLPAFRWMLEIGAILLHTETELVLKSRWVLPERLEQAGFRFAHPELEPALRQLLARPERL
jgi:NAD dependent epimerase/dehydratase family enzyme